MNGIAASPGIAIGKVFVLKEQEINIKRISIENIDNELKKFNDAVTESKEVVKDLYEQTKHNIGQNEAMIFEAHRMILEDPEFIIEIESKIKEEKINAEYAVKEVENQFVSIFENMEDEYMRERAADIKDVSSRIIKKILGINTIDLSNFCSKVIIACRDLTPSDTAQMDKENILGFVTEVGGRTSHSAIMARTLEIPAVVGIEDILKSVNHEDMLIIDGENGEVLINPDDDTIRKYINKKEEYEKNRELLKKMKGSKSITKDGFKVELAGNIGSPNDVDGVINNDGEGIGLYRTEFLYMDREKIPTEQEQFEVYKQVVERMKEKAVVIRTLDIGGDKKLSYLELPDEMNPFLGYRAIRVCLDRVDIFKTQLRALLRASAFGNLKIMFPMISCIEELRDAKKIVEEVKSELREEEIDFNENLEIGIMIEIPAAAIISDILAKEVDFFSIGTNDLIQYTTAVDRMNQKIAHLYNPFHPALLRIIKMIIDNAHREGIWVGMCGEMAGDPDLIPILIGMGLDEFSMSSISILKARWIIKNIYKSHMKNIVDDVLKLSTGEEVKKYLNNNVKYDLLNN